MRLPERSGDQKRIGISIEIPEPFAGELQRARKSFGDPLADAIPPHITIVGPTIIEPAQLEEVHRHIASACTRVEPFEVHLRGSATFLPVSPVVFIQVVAGIAQCENLEREVRSGLLHHETRFNYHPHVTVAHDLDEASLETAFQTMAFYEAQFMVSDLHLFEHGDDNVWRPVKSFPLGV
ncbi:2'-5' RNA ligase family protein [Timonella sp. A28]|uniref:2'-5' RNA ligase family protein n=1 Tax=Timonella sp. A28 TaxID=3442640 RepID=UPI003EBDF1DA